jgi:SAM-dependent methyltransferase
VTTPPITTLRAPTEWDEYFGAEERGFFQGLLMFHRRRFIAPATAHHFDRVFPDSGVFLEAGAGTSESSREISRQDRVLMALDLSYLVLQQFNVLPVRIQGDIRLLPLHDESVSGIWNLGVMEHFTDQELAVVLEEFHRVLAPNGRLLLFWPPWYALHELVLNSVSYLARLLLRKTVVFFPDEVNLYSTRKRAARLFERNGFQIEGTSFGWRDVFSYVVVVASKMPSPFSEEAR